MTRPVGSARCDRGNVNPLTSIALISGVAAFNPLPSDFCFSGYRASVLVYTYGLSPSPLHPVTRETWNLAPPTPPLLVRLIVGTFRLRPRCGSMGAISLRYPRISCALIALQSSPGGLSLNLCLSVIDSWTNRPWRDSLIGALTLIAT